MRVDVLNLHEVGASARDEVLADAVSLEDAEPSWPS